MLAYVFWHQRASQTTREEYQQKLIAFHQILQKRDSEGFLFSMVLETARLPWMKEETEVYEDWYLVENSAALDPLDKASVTGICQEPHNQIARLAAYGTGALYRLKDETITPATLSGIRSVTWFSKPDGMSYAQLYALMPELRGDPQGILWQRQMTMGPALEFCLHNAQENPLPAQIKGIQLPTQPIFLP